MPQFGDELRNLPQNVSVVASYSWPANFADQSAGYEIEMTNTVIQPSLLAKFEHAVKELTQQVGDLPDSNVDEDLRSWLDGADEPLNCRTAAQ